MKNRAWEALPSRETNGDPRRRIPIEVKTFEFCGNGRKTSGTGTPAWFRRPRLRRPTRYPAGESSGSRVSKGTGTPFSPSYPRLPIPATSLGDSREIVAGPGVADIRVPGPWGFVPLTAPNSLTIRTEFLGMSVRRDAPGGLPARR
jgi:hypothetical protein